MNRKLHINMLAFALIAGSSSSAEAQSIIPGWSEQFYYRYGSVVIYKGHRYRAIKPSQNKAPDDNPTYWVDIGEYPVETYTPGLGYTTPSSRAEGGISAESELPASPLLNNAGTTPAAEPAEPAEPVAHDAWDPTRAYATIGQVVSYQGKRWRNTVWTQGEPPGEGPAWVALDIDASDATPEWNSQTVYEEPGLRVKHNGLTWENSAWTQGEEPGRAGVWIAKGRDSTGVQDWDRFKAYSDIGVVVRHLGRTWRNTAWTQGEEPGYAAVWVEPEADRAGEIADWVSTSIYDLPGTIVMHNGRLWQSTAWTQGEEPGYAAVWKEFGARDPSAVAPWNSETVYSEIGTYVSHAGKVWSNSAWTRGEEPGIADVWTQVTQDETGSGTDGGDTGGDTGGEGSEEPGSGGSGGPGSGNGGSTDGGDSGEGGSGGGEVSGISDWVATKIYDQPGTKVRYSGHIWTNRWWTTGDEPGETEAWKWVESEDGTSSWLPIWRAGYVYDTPGTEVEYEDRIWVNAHWTRGEEPGASAAWRFVRSLVDEPLNWHPQMVYDTAGTIVLYEGNLWKNKWWADAKDVPGGPTGAWEAVSADGTTDTTWAAAKNYAAGSEVDHESRRWRAETATLGEEPGTGAAWALIAATTSDPLTWNELTRYVMLDAQVRYDNRIWSNRQDSRGDVPGASPAWKLVSSETSDPLNWHAQMVYDTPGTVVLYEGTYWKNKWWVDGNDVPGGPSGAWEAVSADGTPDTTWAVARSYSPGSEVDHASRRWRAESVTQGEEPGTGAAWALVAATTSDPLIWNQLTHYIMLDAQVRYDSRIWSNLQDSRGDIPGASAAWKLVSSETTEPLTWHSAVIYDRAGITVRHNGTLWESKWWTQNNEPGTSDAWRSLVPTGAGPQNWNPATVYDQVGTIAIYNGQQWRNKWWTQGDTPGAPDGPWELVQ